VDLKLYHLCSLDQWLTVDNEFYVPVSFKNEGFIHLSTADELVETYLRYFQGTDGLLCLEISISVDDTRLVFEPVEGRESEMPHFYGKIPKNNVNQLFRIYDENDAQKIADQHSEFQE
jgi:uncharacterized protein (DUF952 family)